MAISSYKHGSQDLEQLSNLPPVTESGEIGTQVRLKATFG